MGLFSKAPVILLDGGILSSKVCLLGKTKDLGVLEFHNYKHNALREYGTEIKNEDIGKRLVTIMFGKRETIKKLADSLYKLYEDLGENNE